MSGEIKKDIDSIAWLLKQAKKEDKKPKPIVFLGAGASVSAGIPSAKQIVEDILKDFADKPEIKRLGESDKQDYYKLMACLTTSERHELLRGYITNENVKTNVTHIYLAQMLKEGYVDYVLTVNFDDLFLRACALFNFIPPVYDISILNDFTTSTLVEKSITYLHGQHQGFWLLNTGDELKKVEKYVSTVLDRICHQRTWIIVGYSGQDPIFNQITRLGHFTDDLFWIGYNEQEPPENVKEGLLDKANSNAYWLKGYNSDTFFLKLHSELGLGTPEIFNKPFSFLKELLNNVTDIEIKQSKKEHKQLLEKVKTRLDVAKKQTDDAINLYEKIDSTGALSDADISRDKLKQEIIEVTVKGHFTRADELLSQIHDEDEELKELMSDLYLDWAISILPDDEDLGDIATSEIAIEKIKQSIKLKPHNSSAYNNWGVALNNLGELKKDIIFHEEAVEKYQKAIEFDSTSDTAYHNWSHTVLKIAEKQQGEEKKNSMALALKLAKKSVDLGGSKYNLACVYALLNDKKKAFNLLRDSLKRNDVTINGLLQDQDWRRYSDDQEFLDLINNYSQQ